MESVIVQKVVLVKILVPDGATEKEVAQAAARIQGSFREAMKGLAKQGFQIDTATSRMVAE